MAFNELSDEQLVVVYGLLRKDFDSLGETAQELIRRAENHVTLETDFIEGESEFNDAVLEYLTRLGVGDVWDHLDK